MPWAGLEPATSRSTTMAYGPNEIRTRDLLHVKEESYP